MARHIASIDLDIESDSTMDDTADRLERFLSEKIEEFNQQAEENGDGVLIFDFNVTQICEDGESFDDDDDDDDE